MTTKATTAITRRTRGLGLGWTNDVERDPRGGLRVKAPASPDVIGAVRECLAEYDRAARVNSGGTDWRHQWFLGGRPIREAHGIGIVDALRMLVTELPASERARGGSRFMDDTVEVVFVGK